MNPNIVEKLAINMVGLSFYGNPFETKDPWTEENEIGQLWHRFMDYMHKNTTYFNAKGVQMDAMYEVHIVHPNTMKKYRLNASLRFYHPHSMRFSQWKERK